MTASPIRPITAASVSAAGSSISSAPRSSAIPGCRPRRYLQEAGFAGGEELYGEFARVAAGDSRGRAPGATSTSQFLSEVLSEFFTDQGWGALDGAPRSARGAGARLGRMGGGRRTRAGASSPPAI